MLFDHSSTGELLIAIAVGASHVWGARHPKRNIAPSRNVNAPLT